jgi:hypothetical protein
MAFHDQSMTKSFRSHLQQLVTAAGLPTAIVDDIEQMASRYQRLLKDVDVGPVEVDKLPHRAFVAVRDGLEILRVKK